MYDWSSKLYAYEPASDLWEQLAPMPTPRCWLTFVEYAGYLYAMGGEQPIPQLARFHAHDRSRSSAAVERYDPRANTWTRMGDLPQTHTQLRAFVMESGL